MSDYLYNLEQENIKLKKGIIAVRELMDNFDGVHIYFNEATYPWDNDDIKNLLKDFYDAENCL